MNIQLLDPFAKDLPESISFRLTHPEATRTIILAYNRRGNLLAAGTMEGHCLIWDMETRSVSLILKGHILPITSISWTRKGRNLLTSSRDWNSIMWDLETGERKYTIQFDSPVIESQIHPYNSSIIASIIQSEKPLLLKLKGEIWERNEIDLKSEDGQVHLASTLVFSPNGRFLLIGTTKGSIFAYDVGREIIISRFKTQGSFVRHIHFSARKPTKWMLVNCNDRAIRSYAITESEAEINFEFAHKFHDAVNRVQWVQCLFTSDEEYVVGAYGDGEEHKLYIWHRAFGQIFKVLEGPAEGIIDMVWHPYRPVLASLNNYGVIFLWQIQHTQNFSAFAPSFKEIEANSEYQEKEDELDVEHTETLMQSISMAQANESELVVDIGTPSKLLVVSDTEDEEEVGKEPFHIPKLALISRNIHLIN